MALEQAAGEPLSNWFLVARSGDLLLRLKNQLCLGEDDGGEVVLAPDPDTALLSITIREDGLRLRSDRAGWLLRDELADLPGAGNADLLVRTGNTVRLALPNNVFTLSSDSTRHGPITKRITLVAEPEIPTLNTPLPPVEQDVAASEPILPPGVEDLLADIVVSEPERNATSDQSTGAELRFELVENGKAAADAEPSVTDEVLPPARGNRIALAGLLLFLLAALLLTANQTPTETAAIASASETVTPPDEGRGELNIELIRASASRLIAVEELPANDLPPAIAANIADDSSAIATQPETVAVTVNEAPVTEQPDTQPRNPADTDIVLSSEHEDATPAQPKAETDSNITSARDLDPQLTEARRLMAAGQLVEPLDNNAVKVLISVLREDPSNEQALTLIYDAAMQLLEQARVAQASGDDYLARNLTEEVLAFHPTLPDALALKDQLWNQQ